VDNRCRKAKTKTARVSVRSRWAKTRQGGVKLWLMPPCEGGGTGLCDLCSQDTSTAVSVAHRTKKRKVDSRRSVWRSRSELRAALLQELCSAPLAAATLTVCLHCAPQPQSEARRFTSPPQTLLQCVLSTSMHGKSTWAGCR